ncbi:MAG: 50S ribosomal protein L35 [Gammaproteobacteria bacterium]
MPKIRTNRGAAKRFKRTASGKIKHRQSFTSHILTKKSPKRKRQLRENIVLSLPDKKLVDKMLPYM